MLANKLDVYRERGNSYMNNNIQEIQKLYKDKEQKKDKGTIENEEIILIKSYKVSKSKSSTTKFSFINDEVNNLLNVRVESNRL